MTCVITENREPLLTRLKCHHSYPHSYYLPSTLGITLMLADAGSDMGWPHVEGLKRK